MPEDNFDYLLSIIKLWLFTIVAIVILGLTIADFGDEEIFGSIVFGIIMLFIIGNLIYQMKKTFHYRKIYHKGFRTHGVVVLVQTVATSLDGSGNVYYLVKVIMEDKTIRPFEWVKCDYHYFEPGTIVNVRYYDDEILLVHPHDGVWPDEEETKLLEGIKKIHNLNYFG